MRKTATALALLACSAVTLAQTVTSHVARRHTIAPAQAPVCPAVTPVNAAPTLPPGIPPAAGPVQTAFALRYIDVQVGTGDPVTPSEYLTVHYTGWLASNGTKFDSSLDRGEPINFPQGAHRVIPGWDEGFAGMRVGGKRRLFIPYQLAYGEQGRPPVIPPASDLIFDIELVAASANPPEAPPTPPAPPTPLQPPSPPTRPQ